MSFLYFRLMAAIFDFLTYPDIVQYSHYSFSVLPDTENMGVPAAIYLQSYEPR